MTIYILGILVSFLCGVAVVLTITCNNLEDRIKKLEQYCKNNNK